MRNLIRATLNRLQQLRSRPVSQSELSASAIVFAPHQDDETLGCGGTVLRKTDAGADLHIAFLTDGSGSHAQRMDKQQLANLRSAEARAAGEMLGIQKDNMIFLGGADGSLSAQETRIVPQIRRLLDEVGPEQVFIPYARDRQPDHLATHRFVITALRQAASPVTIFEYPVWFWNHWPWMRQTDESLSLQIFRFCRESLALVADFNVHSDIVAVLEQKRTALECHATQMTNFDGSPEWPTLEDVAGGDFLRCLLRDREIFRRRTLSP